MSATKLLQLLEKSGMLDKPLLAELRKQIADTRTKVTAESIAKALVDKGHLTRFQATRLVGEATAEKEDSPPPPPPKPPAETPRPSEDDELGLAPDDAAELGITPTKGKSAGKGSPAKAPSKGDSEEDVVLLEDAGGPDDAGEGLMPVEDAGARLTHVGSIAPELTPVRDSGPVDLSPVGSGLGDFGAEPFAPAGMPSTQPILPPQPPRGGPSWDTMLMYGGGLALALLILFGIVLWYNLTKTPALEMFQAAMEDYRKESYSQAVRMTPAKASCRSRMRGPA